MTGGVRRSLALVLVLVTGIAIGSFVSETMAAFSATTQNSGNSFTSDSDWTPPSVSATAVGKTAGGITGYIKASGTYYVYAQVVDGGNPASGIATVTANTSSFDSGVTAAALTAGSYTANGVSYNYRSASLTADAVGLVHTNSYAYTITSTDNGGRNQTQSGYTVTADTVVPAGTDIQTQNKAGGNNGLAELGDKVVYTFTEQIEPVSVLSTWDGTSTNVVLNLVQNGNNDFVQIWNAANTSQLPLGQIETQGNYVDATVTFGASGTASTMEQSGGVITITLGTPSSTADLNDNGNDTQLWTPAAGATDLAGNACSISVVTELGVNDPDF